jgi:sensor histidine kinase YesM
MFDFVFQTGNAVSDIIIHQKYLEAKNKEIEFSAEFLYPFRLNIDAYDLAIILNNGLENAIEACEEVQEGNRYIKLYAYVKGEMFFIEIENSFVTGHMVIDKNTLLPQSTKSHDGLHGMGLSNIQRCARKYFGDIDFQILQNENNSKFNLTVMLQSKA